MACFKELIPYRLNINPSFPTISPTTIGHRCRPTRQPQFLVIGWIPDPDKKRSELQRLRYGNDLRKGRPIGHEAVTARVAEDAQVLSDAVVRREFRGPSQRVIIRLRISDPVNILKRSPEIREGRSPAKLSGPQQRRSSEQKYP
jgi:hypothetical protein